MKKVTIAINKPIPPDTEDSYTGPSAAEAVLTAATDWFVTGNAESVHAASESIVAWGFTTYEEETDE